MTTQALTGTITVEYLGFAYVATFSPEVPPDEPRHVCRVRGASPQRAVERMLAHLIATHPGQPLSARLGPSYYPDPDIEDMPELGPECICHQASAGYAGPTNL